MKASQNGYHAAYECLVLSHQRMLFNIAFRMPGVYGDARDAVQDSFLAAWQKMGEFRGEAKLSSWLAGWLLLADLITAGVMIFALFLPRPGHTSSSRS